jgi:hypothetical protein
VADIDQAHPDEQPGRGKFAHDDEVDDRSRSVS